MNPPSLAERYRRAIVNCQSRDGIAALGKAVISSDTLRPEQVQSLRRLAKDEWAKAERGS